jgi:hypothetical protein
VLCDSKIDGMRERWIVEHIRALEPGGADHIDNLGPAHEACALAKTRDDHRQVARAKRQKIRHLGADAPKRPLPFGKGSQWKRTLSGTIVPRWSTPSRFGSGVTFMRGVLSGHDHAVSYVLAPDSLINRVGADGNLSATDTVHTWCWRGFRGRLAPVSK